MKLVSAFVGLAALCGAALSPASATPVTVPGQASQASQASNVIKADYVCNSWGHCWDRPTYGNGYVHPHYYGGWHRGWGGYGWHHWHPHYYGGWGYGGGWHHWHQW